MFLYPQCPWGSSTSNHLKKVLGGVPRMQVAYMYIESDHSKQASSDVKAT